MAAGTGKSTPLPAFPSLPLTTPHSTPPVAVGEQGQSLKTPDTSALFMSNLTQDGSPTTSFRSLEELLNVTGINPPSSSSSSSLTPRTSHGVATLAHLAGDVQRDRGQTPDPLSPPTKKAKLGNSAEALLPNIRVQPLSSSGLPSSFEALGGVRSVAVPMQFSSSVSAVAPIQPLSTSSTVHAWGDRVSTEISTVTPSGVGVQTGPASKPMLVPSLYQTPAPPINNIVRQVQTPKVSGLGTSVPLHPLTSTAATSRSLANTVELTAPTLQANTQTPGNSQKSSLVGPRALLVQLIQLYKEYQAIGNFQGMQKVKQQLSELTTLMGVQQKLMATHKPEDKDTCSTSAVSKRADNPQQPPEPVKPVFSVPSGSLASVRQVSSSVMTTSNSEHPTVTLDTSSHGLNSLIQTSTLATSRTSATTVPAGGTAVAPVGGASQMETTPLPTSTLHPGGSSLVTGGPAVATTASPTASLLSHAPGKPMAPFLPFSLPLSSSLATPQTQALRVAVQSYRLKRLQAFLHSLPVENRPRSMEEMREIIRRRPDIFQGLPPGMAVPAQSQPEHQVSSASVYSTSSLPHSLPAVSSQPTSSQTDTAVAAPVLSLPHSIVSAPQVSTSTLTALPHTNSVSAPRHQQGLPSSTSLVSVATEPNMAPTGPAVQPATGNGHTSTLPASTDSPLPSLLPQTNMVSSTAPTGSSLAKPLTSTPTPPSSSSTIQPGVPMPLPPGLTLDTLAMLCRMSDSDLTKLKLPATLLSAIRVWRSKVGPAGLSGSPIPHGSAPALPLVTAPPPAGLSSTQLGQSSRDVPTIVATSGPTQERTWGARQQTVGAAMSMAGVHRPPGRGGVTAVAGPPVVGQGTAGPVIDLTGDTPTSLAPQPMMINPQQGFPPRSLHAFVPHGSMAAMAGSGGIRLPGSGGANSRLVKAFPLSMSTPLHKPPPYTAAHSTVHSTGPMTRHQQKLAQQKAERERSNALRKVLESSEEARIAYKFQAHLDRMHSQLLNPDVSTPFRSLHDATARLLPYHVWNEPEHHHDAWEKADNVFESVAQLLVSQSHGLTSRFQRVLAKDALDDWEGGMRICLEQLFLEGEQERIAQEKKEKQQAEQIAADLSLMAADGGGMTFDPDLAFGDIMNNDPMLSLDSGIT